MASEGLSVKTACRVLDVTRAGFYAFKTRPLSSRAIRNVWLTDLITEIHTASRGTYGRPRVHAELRLARGVVVGHNQVGALMRAAGLVGLPKRRRFTKRLQVITASDLVERDFERPEPNRLWVADLERHEAPLNRVVVKGHRGQFVAASW